MNSLLERLVWAGAGALVFAGLVLIVCQVGAIHPTVKVWLCRLAFLKPLLSLPWAASVVVALPASANDTPTGLLGTYLFVLWLTGASFVSFHAWKAWRGARKLIQASPKVPGANGLRALIDSRGLPNLEVRVLPGLHEPCVVGMIWPKLIIPDAAWFDRAVLLHEVAHIQARDLAWNFLGWASYAAFWFVPGMGRLLKEMSLWQEVHADLVARRDGSVEPSQQAQTLLSMVERSSATSWAVASLSGNAANVARRVTAMYRSRHSALLVVALVPVLFGLAIPVKPSPVRRELASPVASLDTWPVATAQIASK